MSLELPDLIKRAERLLACVSVVLFLLISIASTRTQTFLCSSFFCLSSLSVCYYLSVLADRRRALFTAKRAALVFSTRDWHSNPIKLAHNNNEHERRPLLRLLGSIPGCWSLSFSRAAYGREREARRIPSTRPNCVLSIAANI